MSPNFSHPLTNIQLGSSIKYVGTMNLHHMDSVGIGTYWYNECEEGYQKGNGNTVEDFTDKYWSKFLDRQYIRNPNPKGHWDFKFGDVEIELRRFGFEKTLHILKLGYGNSFTKTKFPWSHKAGLLAKSNGGYLGVLIRKNLFHLIWIPAKILLEHHSSTVISFNQIEKLSEMDPFSHLEMDRIGLTSYKNRIRSIYQKMKPIQRKGSESYLPLEFK